MSAPRRSNSRSLPSSQDEVVESEVVEVLLPVPATPQPLVPFEEAVGRHANTAAADHLLAEHLAGLSASSRRQLAIILKKWCAFLEVVGIRRTPEELRASPAAWGFVSWGLLQAHLKGLLNEGYATSTINLHLAMLRAMIYIAHQAGGIRDESEVQRIRTIRGYGSRRARNVNEQRVTDNIPTRIGAKKEDWVALSPEEAYIMKQRHAAGAPRPPADVPAARPRPARQRNRRAEGAGLRPEEQPAALLPSQGG